MKTNTSSVERLENECYENGNFGNEGNSFVDVPDSYVGLNGMNGGCEEERDAFGKHVQ